MGHEGARAPSLLQIAGHRGHRELKNDIRSMAFGNLLASCVLCKTIIPHYNDLLSNFMPNYGSSLGLSCSRLFNKLLHNVIRIIPVIGIS